MDRTYIEENDHSRVRLKALVANLRDEEFDCPIIPAPWTVGVALCHLAFWDRQWLAKFEEWERTGTVQIPQLGEAVHAINDSMVAWFQTIAPAQVRYETIAAAEAMDSKIASLPQPIVEAVLTGRPRALNRAIHRREHLDRVDEALLAHRN